MAKDIGFEGERPEYKYDCECRKPKPGLLLQAAKEYNIDLSHSVMIGDSGNDVMAGKAAYCKSSFLIDVNRQFGLIDVVVNMFL